MSEEPDLDTARRQGDVCGWCSRRGLYREYLGAGEVEAACAEHADRLRGGQGPSEDVALRGDVRRLVARHGLGAVLQEVARQATLEQPQPPPARDPARLRPPEPGTGVWQEIGADPQHYDHQWLYDRFHLGGESIRCRACSSSIHLDYDRGVWAGEHAQGCPVGHETVPWGTGE